MTRIMAVALPAAALALALMGGCASQLSVYKDRDGVAVPAKGLPFNVPEVYVKLGSRTRMTKATDVKCEDTPFVETVLLPTGDRYFLNVDAMPFTKTGFVAKFGASGALTEVTLNTEPAGADEIKAVNELIKTLAPPAAATTRAIDGGRVGVACDAGEANVRFCTLGEFRAGSCK